MVLRNDPVMEFTIREMKMADMDEVLSIASDPFLTPWTEMMFTREMQLSFSRSLVALSKVQQSRQIAGFITYWIIADEVQLHNIAVHRDFRRRGIASKLFLAMIQEALDQGIGTGTLEVRNSNEAARKLYEKLGCHVLAVRPSYYSESKEDALNMSIELKKCPEGFKHV